MIQNSDNLSSPRRPEVSVTFMILAVIFCTCLIVSNLMEIKTVDVGFFTITAGVVVFPISYIINDCIVEVYGFSKARLVIWLGFGMALLVALLLQLGLLLPGADSWAHQDAMQTIFGAVPRVFAASFIAFLCGSMVNAYVMSRMKIAHKGKGFSVRAILSSLFGEGVDSVIFFPIAFGGILSWTEIFMLIVTQTFLKTFYEIIILPVTVRVVRWLRSIEGHDVTDAPGMSYKWWKINEI